MNGIFLTQSGSLRVFYELVKAVREPLRLGKIGLYVADHTFYSAFCQQCPDIERGRGLLEMERLFDEVQPDFVISFVRLNQQALSLPRWAWVRGNWRRSLPPSKKKGADEMLIPKGSRRGRHCVGLIGRATRQNGSCLSDRLASWVRSSGSEEEADGD